MKDRKGQHCRKGLNAEEVSQPPEWIQRRMEDWRMRAVEGEKERGRQHKILRINPLCVCPIQMKLLQKNTEESIYIM